MLKRRRLNQLLRLLLVAAFLTGVVLRGFSADPTTLHLKSGDRITGIIISETAGELVISNHWNKALTVPLSEIARRETTPPPPPAAAATTAAAIVKPAPVSKPPTNAAAAKSVKYWKGDIQVGLDLIYNTKEQQTYRTRIKLDYERPYRSDPKKFFRHGLEFSAQYGKTDGIKTTDRMNGSDKISFDIPAHWYAYNLGGVGYDRVKKINLQYEEGPGMGYHLIRETNFTMNVEGGMAYQVQDRTDDPDKEEFYYRLAEDFAWKIGGRLSLTEKFEYFPRVDLKEYRFRFESTLAYQFWKNLYLNLTVLDLYDTSPAAEVSENETQVRSSVGVRF